MEKFFLEGSTETSPYAKQLEQGFEKLRFNNELEKEFRLAYNMQNLFRIRFSALSGFILFLAFALLDIVTMPQEITKWTLIMRFGLAIPILIITWLATYHKKYCEHMTPFIASAVITAGMVTVGVIFVAQSKGFPLPYEGIILVTMYAYFLSGLLFKIAIACSLSYFFAYLICVIYLGNPTDTIIFSSFFTFSANIIGAVGCYVLEHTHRKNYLTTKLLDEFAKSDSLTGVYNRRIFKIYFDRLWQQAYRQQTVIAVLMMDVDYFKAYNDRYGHIMGDECLKKIASVISLRAKRPLDFVARYGGEEFVMILFDPNPMFAIKLAEQLRSDINALNITHAGSEIADHVTLSIGVALTTPNKRFSAKELLNCADHALYEAKHKGRNCVAIYDMNKQTTAPSE